MVLDDSSTLDSIKDNFYAKFEDKDAQIEDDLKVLAHIFENEKAKDVEDYIQLLEDLDLFAFTDITVNGVTSNAMIEAFNRGWKNMMQYIFDDGFINIRSILKMNNKFEYEEEIS